MVVPGASACAAGAAGAAADSKGGPSTGRTHSPASGNVPQRRSRVRQR